MRAGTKGAGFPTLVALSLAATALSTVLAASPAPALEGSAVDLLERAREAAQSEAFIGVVVVAWFDGRRGRTAQVEVSNAGGVMRFGEDVVGTGARRLVRSSEGWLTLWSHDVVALGPSPAAKYSLSVSPGPPVAGRPTQVVEARLVTGERARERLYLDDTTGLVLRREMLDARGKPYRSVSFRSIRPSAGASAAPRRSAARDPVPTGHVDRPYDAPARLGAGYRLVGVYEKPKGAVHLFYSDGLHGLSVFEQRGHLGDLPPGGREVEVAGTSVRAYSAPMGEAMVWQGEAVVYTLVSDAPWPDLAAAVASLPHAAAQGRLRSVAEVVVSLFRWR